MWGLLSGFFEKRIQIVEDRRRTFNAVCVVLVSTADGINEKRDPRRFGTAELRFFQVDIVDDLGNWRQCSIVYVQAGQKNFKRAEIPFVCELRIEHIEAQFSAVGAITSAGHELEPCLRVDESTDEPCRCDPIDMDTSSSDPCSSRVPLCSSRELLKRELAKHRLHL